MRKFLILAIFCGAFLLPVSRAVACGGGGDYYQPTIQDFAEYDVIVAGKIIAEDDIELNEILQVDRYYKGEGGEYLAISFYPPALQAAGYIRWYDTSCLYAARWEISTVNMSGWHALYHNGDGTYSRRLTYRAKDGFVEFYSEDRAEYDAKTRLPASEFEQLLFDLIGESETTEPLNSQYPLMRFLNIRTETGERYRLNPDRSLTWLDPAEDPIAISNDGSHVMFRLNDHELGFQYLATRKKPFPPWLNREGNTEENVGYSYDEWLYPTPGKFARFSPNSNLVAVQEEERLAIYLFYSLPKEGAAVGFGHNLNLLQVASHAHTWRATDTAQALVWSADSKALAYQDMEGIWLWRYLEEVEPQLVVPTEHAQDVLELSLTGRYLRYGRKDDWTLLDVQTGDAWNNTLITPDESRKIHFLSEGSDDYLEQLTQLRQPCHLSELMCPILLTLSVHTGLGTEDLPQDFIWQEPDFLSLVYRDAIQSIRWSFSLQWAHCHLASCRGADKLPPISAVAYDPVYEQPAFAFDETKIGFKLHHHKGFVDSVDLSEFLDSPIVSLEWGQPIFYEGR